MTMPRFMEIWLRSEGKAIFTLIDIPRKNVQTVCITDG
jgi:hypothetical protein